MTLDHPTSVAVPGWSGREIVALVLLLLAICFMTWPGMTSEPYYDDLDQMMHVAEFDSWVDAFEGDSFGLFRPLKTLLFYAFQRGGMPSLFTWHLYVLGAYLLATTSIHVFLRSLTGSVWWGFAGACMWATSATQASTAVWMSCINISVAIVFTCAALHFHVASWRDGRRWMVVPFLLSLFLALASYETALFIAPMCVLLDHFHGRRIFSKPALLRYSGIAIVTMAYLCLRALMGGTHDARGNNLGFDPDMPEWQLAVSAPWFLWRHFSMWVFPFGRIEFLSTYLWGKSASMWELAGGWVFLVSLIGIAIGSRKRLPLLSFGIAWFLLASFPSSNLIPIWSGPIEDYYVVFPGVGLTIATVALLQPLVRYVRQSGSRPLMQLSAGGLVALAGVSRLASAAYFPQQAALWNDPLAQQFQIIATRPCQFQSMTIAARDYLNLGQYDLAEKYALESLEMAAWYPSTHSVLGSVDIRAGRYEDAIKRFDICYRLSSGRGELTDFCLLGKGDALVALRRPGEARQVWLEILVNPASNLHFDTTLRLAVLYHGEGNTEKAVQTLKKSRQIHPARAREIDAALAELAERTRNQSSPAAQ